MAITGELADLAEATIGDAARVLVNARRHLHRQGEGAAGRLEAAVTELDTILDRAGRVIAQTRTRLSGITPASATRLVSLHDPDARPIAKGRLGKPVEFGYKAQFTDNTDGIVLDYSAHEGNPADAPLLAPGIGRIKSLFGTPPGAVTADRGYGEAKVDETLTGLGVNTVVIPRKGKPSAARREVEHGRGFRRLVKWRTGSEGRISYLKRRYGLHRTLFDGLTGAQTWCGLGVLAHNSVKIATLVQARRTGTTGHLARRVVTGRVQHVPARPCVPGPAATGPPDDPQLTLDTA
jgi:transposase, IS5 family